MWLLAYLVHAYINGVLELYPYISKIFTCLDLVASFISFKQAKLINISTVLWFELYNHISGQEMESSYEFSNSGYKCFTTKLLCFNPTKRNDLKKKKKNLLIAANFPSVEV